MKLLPVDALSRQEGAKSLRTMVQQVLCCQKRGGEGNSVSTLYLIQDLIMGMKAEHPDQDMWNLMHIYFEYSREKSLKPYIFCVVLGNMMLCCDGKQVIKVSLL